MEIYSFDSRENTSILKCGHMFVGPLKDNNRVLND